MPGYLLSKVEPLVNTISSGLAELDPKLLITTGLLLISVINSFASMFVFRRYFALPRVTQPES